MDVERRQEFMQIFQFDIKCWWHKLLATLKESFQRKVIELDVSGLHRRIMV